MEQTLWADPAIVRNAGTVIYLTHLSMPALVTVEAAYGRRFDSVEQLRSSIERTAWVMIAGTGCLPDHPAGAADPVIAARLAHVGAMHRAWPMPPWAMPFVASVLSAAPAWVLGHRYPSRESAYHQSAARTAAALGTVIPRPELLDRWLRSMIARRSGPTPYGRQAIRIFAAAYGPLVEAVMEMEAVPVEVRQITRDALS